MTCFLTSSPMIPELEEPVLNPANGFAQRLRDCLPDLCRVLYVCSDPDHPEETDFYAGEMRFSLEEAGIRLRAFTVLDRRKQRRALSLVRRADLIILAGGHVPTQNRFFREIGLKRLLRRFDGVLVGISAGTMNCAETVYAQPEEEGEALDPDYRRFLPGLGLTKRMILPHFQMICDQVLDGLRVIEDIAFPDSFGREILIFPDGTYLRVRDGREEVCGEAWRLADGVMTPLCGPEETVLLQG